MARNSFRSMEAIWKFKAKLPHSRPGMSAYAAKKSHFSASWATRYMQPVTRL